MSDLKSLYQEIILEHYRKPRNFGPLDGAGLEASGHNPLCGDRIKVSLVLDQDQKVSKIAFEGAGCAISTASASLMTEAVKGKTTEEAQELFKQFRDMVTGRSEIGEPDLGKLEALAGVRDLPIRIKCATLAWHTLQAALTETSDPISTE